MSKHNQQAWKRMYNQKKPYDKAKQFMHKKVDTFFSKLMVFVFFPIAIFLLSLWLFFEHAYIAGILIWIYLPLTFFLLMGALKNRVLNSLPFIIFGAYMLYGIETGLWQEGTILFFAVPIGSLVLKPKKYPIQYAALAVSIAVLTINMFTNISIPIYIKWILIFGIYFVFLPPFLIRKLEAFLEKHSQ